MPGLSSRDRFEAIREVIEKAPVFDQISSRKPVAEAVIKRERILSTGLGKGVAVAHGTTNAVEDVVIALGISEQGIDFDAIDKAPVHLLFVITNPPTKQVEYLTALSTVARLVRDDSFRESLRTRLPPREIERNISRAFCETLKKHSQPAL